MYDGVMDIKPGIGQSPGSSMQQLSTPVWEGRSISGPKLRLREFVSFLTVQREQEKAENEVSTERTGQTKNLKIASGS